MAELESNSVFNALPLMLIFVISTSITPGPNNVMVTASGARHGFWRTLPHVVGVSAGLVIMLLGLGLGLSRLFATLPALHIVLRVLALALLGYLAWKIASASPISAPNPADRPWSFVQAAGFQWVNPKVWVMLVSALTTFSLGHQDSFLQVTMLALVFVVAGMPCVALWAAFGSVLGKVLVDPGASRAFNVVMAMLLLASVVPLALRG